MAAPLRKRLLQRCGLYPSEQLFAVKLGAPLGLPFLDSAVPFRPRDAGTPAIARSTPPYLAMPIVAGPHPRRQRVRFPVWLVVCRSSCAI